MPPLRWIFFLVFISLASLIMGTIFWFEAQRVISFIAIIDERTEQLEGKEEKIERYREQIEFYRTREGMAHLGREMYNFVYPGERIYIFEESKDLK